MASCDTSALEEAEALALTVAAADAGGGVGALTDVPGAVPVPVRGAVFVGAATGSGCAALLNPPRDWTTPNVTAVAVATSARPTNQPARRRRDPSSSGGASTGASDGVASPVTVD